METTTNEEAMKQMLADQERRDKEAKEKMKQRNKATSTSSTSGTAVQQGTITVGGKSLARVTASTEERDGEDNIGKNPEDVAAKGEKRKDYRVF